MQETPLVLFKSATQILAKCASTRIMILALQSSSSWNPHCIHLVFSALWVHSTV